MCKVKLIVQETYGDTKLNFSYDANGNPYTFSYTKGDNSPSVYHYVLNLQGDVVRIVTNKGVTRVTYEYDAWGNITNMTYTNKTLADANPLRYRGYYYDRETGLYYLQSRYYNPQWGRFINGDGYVSTGKSILGNNMFAYCFNNPINMDDSFGNWPKFLEEIKDRLVHAFTFTTRIITSPLKATTIEIGGGVGYGGSVGISFAGIPAEVSAFATAKDTYVYDKGAHDVHNTTSAEIGLQLGPLGLLHANGKQHSYFDEQCSCSFMNSTFGEKADCSANESFATNESTLSISAGLYLVFGLEASVSFDFKAWGEELISIYNDSFSFQGNY